MRVAIDAGVVRGVSPSPDHLSTAVAAALLGWSHADVRLAVRSGELEAVAVAGNIRISRTAVETRMSAGDALAAADITLAEVFFGMPLHELPLVLDPEFRQSDWGGVAGGRLRWEVRRR